METTIGSLVGQTVNVVDLGASLIGGAHRVTLDAIPGLVWVQSTAPFGMAAVYRANHAVIFEPEGSWRVVG